MTNSAKTAVLLVDTVGGKREVAMLSDDYAPVRALALAAQSAGEVDIDGKAAAITGGFILCSWRPGPQQRFRCEPAKAKAKRFKD
jgi:hypothetical protein